MSWGDLIGKGIKSLWDLMTDANAVKTARITRDSARGKRNKALTDLNTADAAFKANRDLEAQLRQNIAHQDDYIKNYVDSVDLENLYKSLTTPGISQAMRRSYIDRIVKQLAPNAKKTPDENVIELAKWFDPSWIPVTKDISSQANEAIRLLFVDPAASKATRKITYRTLDQFRNPFRQRVNQIKADYQNDLNLLLKDANYQQQLNNYNAARTAYDNSVLAHQDALKKYKTANRNHNNSASAWKTSFVLSPMVLGAGSVFAPDILKSLFTQSGEEALKQTPDNFAPTYQDPLPYHFGSYYTPNNSEWEGGADGSAFNNDAAPAAQRIAAFARKVPSVKTEANPPVVTTDESPLDYIPDPAPVQTVQNTAAPANNGKTVIPDGLYPNSIKGTREWLAAQKMAYNMASYKRESAKNALPPGMSPAEGVQRGIIPYEALQYF